MRPNNSATIACSYRGKHAQHRPQNREICREDVEHSLGVENAARLERALYDDQAGVDMLLAELAVHA
jgi:hypothetical protein